MIKPARLPGLTILATCLLCLCGIPGAARAATPQVAAAGNHTLLLKADNTLWSWGDNSFGQVGDGTAVSRSFATQVEPASVWTAVAAGFYHTLALKADGTLWAWGDNTKGQLGDGSSVSRNAPVRVGTDTNWAAVAAGDFHSLALKTDGSLWAWGENTSGQVGDGSVVPGNRAAPVRVGTAADWTAIAAGGSHSLALKANHTLWAWGANGSGQLGNGTNIDATAPVQVVLPAPFTNSDWSAVSAGQFHSVALKTDGSLWSWGDNNSGQLGTGATPGSNVPVREAGSATTWSAITAGDSHSLGRRTDGTLWGWGGNANGQLGTGTNQNAVTPVQVGTATDWSAADAGSVHTVALKTDGSVWSWGDNASGQLGNGTTSPGNTPGQIAVAPLTVTLLADKSSPRSAGTPLTFTATAGGGTGAPVLYQFWLKDTTGVYTLVQPFSAANAWNWATTGLPAGTYSVAAQVKAAGTNPPNGFEAETVTNFVLAATAATTLDVQVAPPSPQIVGTLVAFTATAGGGSGPYEYQFWLKDLSGAYTLAQPFSAANTWNWATAGLPPGTYAIAVQAKSSGSNLPNGFDVETVVNFTVSPAPALALDVVTRTVGTDVAFTASASGGTGPYEYRFWLKDLSGVYTLVQAYSAANVWNWPTAGLPAGTYSVAVQAKSVGSTRPNGFDVENVVDYLVGP